MKINLLMRCLICWIIQKSTRKKKSPASAKEKFNYPTIGKQFNEAYQRVLSERKKRN